MRWKAIIPIIIFISLLIAFCLFMLDPLVECIFEKAGTKINGAKVEVASVDISLTKSYMQINGLQVTDKSDPWKNLFETKIITFDYALEPMFFKKLLVEEMSAEGLRWGTKRQTSGEVKKIKKKGPSVIKKMAQKLELPKFDTSKIEKLKDRDWKKELKPENLRSLKAIEETETKAKDLQKKYEDKIKSIDLQSTIDNLNASVTAAQSLKISGVGDIPKAKKTLDDLNASRKLLKEKITEIGDLKKQFGTDFADARSTLKSVTKFRDGDVSDILSKFDLPDFSAKGIGRALLGPLWLNRLEKTIYYVGLARKYMPSKSEKDKEIEEPPVERRAGITVLFPDRRSWPKFLIKKILVSGSTGNEEKQANEIVFSGQILGITSNPALYGKPAKIDLKGKLKGSKKTSIGLLGILDHTGEVSKDKFTVNASGLNLAGKKWDLPAYIPSTVQSGSGEAKFHFEMAAEKISAQLSANASGLKLTGSQESPSQMEQIIQSAFSEVPTINLSAKADGSKDNLDFSVNSNLDNIIASKLKSMAGGEIEKVRAQVEAQVRGLVDKRLEEAKSKLDLNQKGL